MPLDKCKQMCYYNCARLCRRRQTAPSLDPWGVQGKRTLCSNAGGFFIQSPAYSAGHGAPLPGGHARPCFARARIAAIAWRCPCFALLRYGQIMYRRGRACFAAHPPSGYLRGGRSPARPLSATPPPAGGSGPAALAPPLAARPPISPASRGGAVSRHYTRFVKPRPLGA